MRVQLQTVLLMLIGLLAGLLLAGAVVLYAGFYNVSATDQHLRPTFWLLKTGVRESIQRHARHIQAPDLTGVSLAQRGFALYHTQCAQCHGAPGVPPAVFALGLTPAPTNLSHRVRQRTSAELYWVVKNGIKMTAMPAWEFRLADSDLWAIVAFLRELPLVSPAQYAVRLRTIEEIRVPTEQEIQTAADAQRGKVALEQYACMTCHRIPGVVGDHAPVGPPLERVGTRRYLGGVVLNSYDNMIRWLRNPQGLHPGTAMPNLGVTQRDASDMAAYLSTLK